MSNQLTDAHIDELQERGYVIVPNFLDEEQRKKIASAVRNILKPWDEIREAPPQDRSDFRIIPFTESILNEAAINHDAIHFARQWFRTDHIHFRPRSCLVRYPGFKWPSASAHLDNGNNSLLPPTDDRTHKQIWFWISATRHDFVEQRERREALFLARPLLLARLSAKPLSMNDAPHDEMLSDSGRP